MSTYEFTYQALVVPHMFRRYHITNYELQANLFRKMCELLGVREDASQELVATDKAGRCDMCVAAIWNMPNYIERHNKIS